MPFVYTKYIFIEKLVESSRIYLLLEITTDKTK